MISILESSTHVLLKIFFPRSKHNITLDEPEANTIELDDLSPLHQKYMLNMADIEKKQIKDILMPWAQTISVSVTNTAEEVLQVFISSGHTRLPVKKDDFIIGVLHTKEFIALKESGESGWQGIIRPTLTVKSNASALGTLRLMQEKKTHMAVVTSLSGQLVGIVTLEDIIEEIVGDIYDEDDDGLIRKIYTSKIKSRAIPKEK